MTGVIDVCRLDYIRARCRVTEDDCWLWLLATCRTGRPLVNSMLFSKNGSVRRAHREAWAASGKRLTEQQVLLNTCGNVSCCNPAHHRAVSRSDYTKSDAYIRSRSNGALHRAVVTVARRNGKGVKLSLDIARKIRARYAEIGNHSYVASEFGLRPSDVHRIVIGLRWREPPMFPG